MKRQWLVVAAVLLFFFLALDSVMKDSPVVDEQYHVTRGLVYLGTGDPRFSLVHPPLINTLSALPLLTIPDVELPLDDANWEERLGWFPFSRTLFWESGLDVTRAIFLARLPIIFLTLGMALIGYHFARTFWGPSSALFAFLFLLFDPNILAHGRYSTTDLGGAAFLLLAVFSLWHLWSADDWSWPRLLLTGAALGLAFSSKLSAPAFVFLFGLVAVIPPLYGQVWNWRNSLRALVQLGLSGLIGLFIVWAAFAFEWGPFRFNYLESVNRFQGPMPTFWAGLEHVYVLARGGRHAFLLGEYSYSGFPAYFLVTFLVKTPLPILLLLPAAAVYLVKRRPTRASALFLVVPSLLFFLLLTPNSLNVGYRHLLPVLPFLLLLISGLASTPLFAFRPPQRLFRDGWPSALASLLLPLAILSILAADVWIHPHYLSYFNLASGGPENGHEILIDSSIDWGQDLIRLKQWMEENDVEEVKLAWYGTAVPDYYGIEYDPLPGMPHHFDLWDDPPLDRDDPEPGIYAISVTMLWELPSPEKETFAWFRAREPDDRVGYSIFIYRVE